MQEDPEMTEFKKAAADTAHDVKESVKPDDKASSKSSNDKTVLESVSCRFLHEAQLEQADIDALLYCWLHNETCLMCMQLLEFCGVCLRLQLQEFRNYSFCLC